MVKKKVLKAQIDFLLQRIEELTTTIRYNEQHLEYLNSHFKELESNFADYCEKQNELCEKVEYIYRQNGLLSENDNSLFDEWMNGAKKEGEN